MRKLVIMDENGEYQTIRSIAQFWAMVTPINEKHRQIIKSTQFYQELQRKEKNYGYYR